MPCAVTFIGYGSGRGLPVHHLAYAAAGFAVFVMDNRAQAGWTLGGTADPTPGTGSEAPGVMTRGISSKESYFYARLYVDGVRAVRTTFSATVATTAPQSGSWSMTPMAPSAWPSSLARIPPSMNTR